MFLIEGFFVTFCGLILQMTRTKKVGSKMIEVLALSLAKMSLKHFAKSMNSISLFVHIKLCKMVTNSSLEEKWSLFFPHLITAEHLIMMRQCWI